MLDVGRVWKLNRPTAHLRFWDAFDHQSALLSCDWSLFSSGLLGPAGSWQCCSLNWLSIVLLTALLLSSHSAASLGVFSLVCPFLERFCASVSASAFGTSPTCRYGWPVVDAGSSQAPIDSNWVNPFSLWSNWSIELRHHSYLWRHRHCLLHSRALLFW